MRDVQITRELLVEMEMRHETEFFDAPHVVMVRDSLIGSMPQTVVGPFPTVIEALAYAERVQKDLSTHWEESTDPLPDVSVAPILAPEDNPNIITA